MNVEVKESDADACRPKSTFIPLTCVCIRVYVHVYVCMYVCYEFFAVSFLISSIALSHSWLNALLQCPTVEKSGELVQDVADVNPVALTPDPSIATTSLSTSQTTNEII